MITDNYKKLEDLTPQDTELLIQTFTRLIAEGLIDDYYHYGDLLDVVLARGDYSNTKTDEATYEDLMEMGL